MAVRRHAGGGRGPTTASRRGGRRPSGCDAARGPCRGPVRTRRWTRLRRRSTAAEAAAPPDLTATAMARGGGRAGPPPSAAAALVSRRATASDRSAAVARSVLARTHDRLAPSAARGDQARPTGRRGRWTAMRPAMPSWLDVVPATESVGGRVVRGVGRGRRGDTARHRHRRLASDRRAASVSRGLLVPWVGPTPPQSISRGTLTPDDSIGV